VTIEFRCSCGAICRADEAEVGHLYHCEACGLDLPVPSPEEAERVIEADAAQAGEAEGEPVEGEAPPSKAGLDDLQRQVVSDQERAHATREAESRQGAAEALREQLGGGGVGDIAAGLQDAEDEAARADAVALAEKRRGDADALREQLGGGGVADIAAALRGEAEKTGPTAEADRAPAPPPIDLAALRQRAAAGRKPQKKVLRGHERAAHHITFKRAIWIPALLIGLVCIAVGVLASVFHIHPVWAVKDLLAGEPSAYEAHMRLFEEKLTEAGIPLDGFEIVEHGGEAWAVPKGATFTKTAGGQVVYINSAGYQLRAVNAEDYADCQAIRQQGRSGLVMLGVGLVAVGLALGVLSIITYRDVRIVHAAQAQAAEEEAEEALETPVEPGDVAEKVEETAPTAEGEHSETEAEPQDEQDEPRPTAGTDEADQTGAAPRTGEAETAGAGEEPPTPPGPPDDDGTDEEQHGPGASG